MNKRNTLIGVVAAAVLVLGGAFFYFFSPTSKEEAVHYHAGFQVYVDDKLQDFSDLKYMQVSPCGRVFRRENDQIEKAHLHDTIGDVVHVHRTGAVWGDLFKNLGFDVGKESEFVGYLNGNLQQDILLYPIIGNDSVVFFKGPIKDMNKKLQSRVTLDHIQEVEARSEDCGKK